MSSESLLGSGSDAGEEHDDIADFLRHYKPPNRPRLGKASNKKPQYPLDFLVARVLFLAGRVSLGAEQICTRVASEWLYFGTVPPPALLTMMLRVLASNPKWFAYDEASARWQLSGYIRSSGLLPSNPQSRRRSKSLCASSGGGGVEIAGGGRHRSGSFGTGDADGRSRSGSLSRLSRRGSGSGIASKSAAPSPRVRSLSFSGSRDEALLAAAERSGG